MSYSHKQFVIPKKVSLGPLGPVYLPQRHVPTPKKPTQFSGQVDDFYPNRSRPKKSADHQDLGNQQIHGSRRFPGGGFIFLFSPLLGEMIQFDEHIFQMGLVQPPTSMALCVFFLWQDHGIGEKLRCSRSGRFGRFQ